MSSAEPMETTERNLHALCDEVAALRDYLEKEGQARLSDWGLETAAPGARNLACCLALRGRDLSELQLRLAAYGLSSLGRSEADVLGALDALLATLRRLCGEESDYPARAGEDALAAACNEIFGGCEDRTRIMATLPSEAADDPGLVSALIDAGMDCARINCAHDDAATWARMAGHVRNAAERLGRPCRVLMDIAGPKLRLQEVRGPEKCRLFPGDRLRLVPQLGKRGKGMAATLNFPQVVAQLQPGAEISFDDGKASGRILSSDGEGAQVEITASRAKGLRLKPGKGVNLPAVDLDLSPLTEKDLADLDAVARLADLVGFSFVQRVEDIALLDRELTAHRGDAPRQGLMLKIETPLALRNLPRLMVEAAARRPAAVMIARGDLAVEVGFARLSEMQEEILWLCEAAHMPVIWATQCSTNMCTRESPAALRRPTPPWRSAPIA